MYEKRGNYATMQSIGRKGDRNEEANKNVEEAGNERYGGSRGGGGWLGGRFGRPSPLTDGCLPARHGQETKLSKLVVYFYNMTIWMMTKSE